MIDHELSLIQVHIPKFVVDGCAQLTGEKSAKSFEDHGCTNSSNILAYLYDDGITIKIFNPPKRIVTNNTSEKDNLSGEQTLNINLCVCFDKNHNVKSTELDYANKSNSGSNDDQESLQQIDKSSGNHTYVQDNTSSSSHLETKKDKNQSHTKKDRDVQHNDQHMKQKPIKMSPFLFGKKRKVDTENDENPRFRQNSHPDPMLPNIISFTPMTKRPKLDKDTEMPCKLCDIGVLKIDTLRKHVHKHHRLHGQYADYVFELGGTVVIKEDCYRRVSCKLCNYVTEVEVALFRHVRNQHPSHVEYLNEMRHLAQKFICSVCNKSFNSRASCTKHKRNEHPDFSDDEEQHICHVCNKQLKNAQSLKHHIKTQHEESDRVMCHLCPMTFKSKYNLTFHIRNCHGSDFSYRTCEMCQTKLSSEYALKKHLKQVHEKSRDHVCDQCGKGFGTKTALVSHVNVIHDKVNLKQHQCSVCNKKFNSTRNLQRHVKFVHLHAFPWYCHICTPSKGYRQGYQFRNHLKSQHSELVAIFDTDAQIRSFSLSDAIRLRNGELRGLGSHDTSMQQKQSCSGTAPSASEVKEADCEEAQTLLLTDTSTVTITEKPDTELSSQQGAVFDPSHRAITQDLQLALFSLPLTYQ